MEIVKRIQEEIAIVKARKLFRSWKSSHPTEARILELLDVESQHLLQRGNPRRNKLYTDARDERRMLGIRDELVLHIRSLPFILDEHLLHLDIQEKELSFVREVNYGYWARAGLFTPGIRSSRRLS